ncbi:MAG: hypothetical protein A4S12_03985 [Proteobacteria bacterium SG_bin5]|nr:PIN domain-containing protein [Sphingomonas sp.]OQW43734.1 MAG: hypothetical protein A4S12_03985 [Proteobacteria bacterium SG_bin5]
MKIDGFLDSNILVYAAYPTPGEDWKQEIAIDLIESNEFAISSQVLFEFLNSTTRKRKPGLTLADAHHWLETLPAATVVGADRSLVAEAVALADRYRIVFWDGAIIAAAGRAGAKTLYTEDLNDGQHYGAVQVVNPFNRTGEDAR